MPHFFRDIPGSTLVGVAATVDQLAQLLLRATGGFDLSFPYIDGISGARQSGRIASQNLIPNFTQTSPLPKPPDAKQLAETLLSEEQLKEMEFDPPEPPSVDYKPGWEVRTTHVQEKGTVILWATWVLG